ncbi:MAG TPA: DUF2267 domain-containing protein [Candidatus Limnocylindrales bacterium]|nr:DUF2267 domain-containing protein [Candidatus Limnocylindrales bacterium]
MSVTGLEVFDATVHKTNAWLKRLMAIGGWEDRHLAYICLRATLHALRDRLTVEEVAELAAQLPMLVRGFYYEGWDPTDTPTRVRRREEFLARIQRELPPKASVDPEPAARAVFRLLSERVADGEIDEVRHVLPEDIRELWPTPAAGEPVIGRAGVG